MTNGHEQLGEVVDVRSADGAPPEEAAEELGAAALGAGEVDTTLADDPKEDIGLAQEMAGAEAPLRDMIKNVRESNLPNKDALVETLEKDIDNITDQAKEKYLEAEQRYKTVRDSAVGNIMLVLRGEVPAGKYGRVVVINNLSHTGGRAELGEGEENNVWLNTEQVERLRGDIYTLFGAEPPDTFIAETGSDGNRYSQAEAESNIKVPGRKIVERRNVEKGQTYPRMMIGLEGS